MDTNRKKVLVVGTGISGIAAAELLIDHGDRIRRGMEVVLYDGNEKLSVAQVRQKSDKLSGVPILLGELQDEALAQVFLAILSPGVPLDSPLAEKLRQAGVEIWGEIELAYRLAKGRVVAITGTNGKTTTTALTGEILKSAFSDVQVVGNIGIPYTSVAAQTADDTVTVAEISSFQLETARQFCPEVSAILNITPDHLNRHHTMECYISVKESITKNQKPGQTCVLNYEDEVLRQFGEKLNLHSNINVIFFSSRQKLNQGLYLEGGVIYRADAGVAEAIIEVDKLHLLGNHNYENVMAATAIALAFGVPLEKIIGVLKEFQSVEHRIEYVAEISGVRYYNDSKGTNPDAAIQGIRAMDRPTYLIGGGYDKQSEYESWIDAFDGKVQKLVLIGETKEAIAKSAEKKGFLDVVFCETLEEAVGYCHSHAKPGEAVLLSPACASWDMFHNYEERGRVFKETVRKYQK